jgi:hypothetical protein
LIDKQISPSQNKAVESFQVLSRLPISNKHVVAMNDTASYANQPFKQLRIYVCPYKAERRCSHKDGFFDSFRGLTQHVRQAHGADGLLSTYEECPDEDGTSKIPCPNGCGHLAVSHQKANFHAKNSGCPVGPQKDISCAWKPFNGCEHVCDEASSVAIMHVITAQSRRVCICTQFRPQSSSSSSPRTCMCIQSRRALRSQDWTL